MLDVADRVHASLVHVSSSTLTVHAVIYQMHATSWLLVLPLQEDNAVLAAQLQDVDATFWAYYDATRASWDLQQLQVRAHACTASFPVHVRC